MIKAALFDLDCVGERPFIGNLRLSLAISIRLSV